MDSLLCTIIISFRYITRISTKQVNSNLINTIWNFDICKISEIETSIDLNQKNFNYKIIWCLNTYLKKENLKSIQVKNILHDIYSWHPIVPVLCKYLFPLNSIQAILKQSRLQYRFLRALCIYIYIHTRLWYAFKTISPSEHQWWAFPLLPPRLA